MTKNKGITFFLILSMLSSCRLTKDSYRGTYEYKSKNAIGIFELKDSIFKLRYEMAMVSYESKGQWYIQNKKLILKSYDYYNNNYLIVDEKLDVAKKIKVIDKYNFPVESADIVVNGANVYTTNEKGEVDLSEFTEDVNTIKILYFDITDNHGFYKTKNSNSNLFIMKIIPKDYGKEYFDYDTLNISKRKIIINNHKYLKVK